MRLQDVLAEMELDVPCDVLRPHWQESQASFPPGMIPFLDPAEFMASRAYADLPAEMDASLHAAAKRIRGQEALARLAWHCHRLHLKHVDYPAEQIGRWPSLEPVLGELAGAFYLLIGLAVVPPTRAAHAARGVPDAITRATCRDIRELLDWYSAKHPGQWGVPVQHLYWLRHYAAGELYTLGRLEFMIRPFAGQVRAYRSAETGQVLALAEDGVWFDERGHTLAGQDEQALAKGWHARLVMDDDAIRGFPISPAGVAVRREVRLDRRRWVQALAPGDPVIEVHIAAGGGMTLERCRDSMSRALEFFPRYFPDRPFAGFTCASWILNPELAEFYSPTSNMVLWQRELYLFPWPSNGRAGLFFVFADDDVDPAAAPRDTSLRRAMLDRLAAGGVLRNGGMFMLKEHFSHFGTQYYLSHWPAVCRDLDLTEQRHDSRNRYGNPDTEPADG